MTVGVPAERHLDALQPVPQQKPGAAAASCSANAAGAAATAPSQRQGGAGRRLLGCVLPDRRPQRAHRAGGSGWPRAPACAAAGLRGNRHCG